MLFNKVTWFNDDSTRVVVTLGGDICWFRCVLYENCRARIARCLSLRDVSIQPQKRCIHPIHLPVPTTTIHRIDDVGSQHVLDTVQYRIGLVLQASIAVHVQQDSTLLRHKGNTVLAF